MKWNNNDYWITDDNDAVDIDYVHRTLNTTYWAADRPKEIVEKSIRNSVMLSLFNHHRQIGYARIVSDYATFAWLCDVYIDPEYRGQGLGAWLCKCYLEHPSSYVSINLLATKDAHALYEKFGFKPKECMILVGNDRYDQQESA